MNGIAELEKSLLSHRDSFLGRVGWGQSSVMVGMYCASFLLARGHELSLSFFPIGMWIPPPPPEFVSELRWV